VEAMVLEKIIAFLKNQNLLNTSSKQEQPEDAAIYDDNLGINPEEQVSGSKIDNNAIKILQVSKLFGILVILLILVVLLTHFIQRKIEVKNDAITPGNLKHELADKALDPEKMWRNYHEEDLNNKTKELSDRLSKVEDTSKEQQKQLLESTRAELDLLKEQIKAAREELLGASDNLRKLSVMEEERLSISPFIASSLDEEYLDDEETTYDTPKSAANYVPEGTYFSGYLLTGLVVSTAINTPSENAIPLTIRLQGRGNLDDENDLDISKCRIMGSAYGDLSSERAMIRLEKMVCKEGGSYITTHIAGDVHGPDGMNGIKGSVVSTGAKHIKNAAIGGLISGLSESAKGQSAMTLSGSGLLSTQKQGFSDMTKSGLLSGTSNAGEKIADYYLRQAESMSPVLTIPGGVRVDAHMTKGFFLGETSTHRKITESRASKQTNNTQTNGAGGQNNENW
jgi:hypothetical protein